MKKGLIICVGFLAPVLVWAQTPQQKAAQEAAGFVDTFNTVIIYPLIALMSAVAFLVFIWGLAEYFFNASNEQSRQQGVRHITWGIIGLLIMVTAWGIMELFAATFDLDDELNCADNPSAGGCDSAFTLP